MHPIFPLRCCFGASKRHLGLCLAPVDDCAFQVEYPSNSCEPLTPCRTKDPTAWGGFSESSLIHVCSQRRRFAHKELSVIQARPLLFVHKLGPETLSFKRGQTSSQDTTLYPESPWTTTSTGVKSVSATMRSPPSMTEWSGYCRGPYIRVLVFKVTLLGQTYAEFPLGVMF